MSDNTAASPKTIPISVVSGTSAEKQLGGDKIALNRADALFRVRDTGHQLALHRGERARNLQGAFVVSPRHAAWVRGARIALVDDVLTTGATAHAATRTLRAAGARDVQVWVVARTPDV